MKLKRRILKYKEVIAVIGIGIGFIIVFVHPIPFTVVAFIYVASILFYLVCLAFSKDNGNG